MRFSLGARDVKSDRELRVEQRRTWSREKTVRDSLGSGWFEATMKPRALPLSSLRRGYVLTRELLQLYDRHYAHPTSLPSLRPPIPIPAAVLPG